MDINIQALSNLLHNDKESSDDDELDQSSVSGLNPGSIGPKKSTKTVNKKLDPNNIWDVDDVPDIQSIYQEDYRPRPDYEIKYSQSITPEDMFLQMGYKNPSTVSCESLVLHVKLPDCKSADSVNLDVREKFVDIRSPEYHLPLHLPHPVVPDSGKAKFDIDKQTLIITLKLNRDYEFLNDAS